METSLRFDSGAKALRIHAKEKFPLFPDIHCQVHGELDTSVGNPTSLALIIRKFFPQFSADTGFGVVCGDNGRLKYRAYGKTSFPFTSDGLFSFNLKARHEVDRDLSETWSRGAAELSWGIINFQKSQDLLVKVGYEAFDKVPYLQIRENNWTLNADMKGRWNIRFDL